jgi:hypothetical protein
MWINAFEPSFQCCLLHKTYNATKYFVKIINVMITHWINRCRVYFLVWILLMRTKFVNLYCISLYSFLNYKHTKADIILKNTHTHSSMYVNFYSLGGRACWNLTDNHFFYIFILHFPLSLPYLHFIHYYFNNTVISITSSSSCVSTWKLLWCKNNRPHNVIIINCLLLCTYRFNGYVSKRIPQLRR